MSQAFPPLTAPKKRKSNAALDFLLSLAKSTQKDSLPEDVTALTEPGGVLGDSPAPVPMTGSSAPPRPPIIPPTVATAAPDPSSPYGTPPPPVDYKRALERFRPFAPPAPVTDAPVRSTGEESKSKLVASGIATLLSLISGRGNRAAGNAAAVLRGGNAGFERAAEQEQEAWQNTETNAARRDAQARQAVEDANAIAQRELTGEVANYNQLQGQYDDTVRSVDAAAEKEAKKAREALALENQIGDDLRALTGQLVGMSPESQQEYLASLDSTEAGRKYLARLGNPFPKDASGNFTVSLRGAKVKTPEQLEEDNRVTQVNKDIAALYKRLDDPRLDEAGQQKVIGQINALSATVGRAGLGIGANNVAPMSPQAQSGVNNAAAGLALRSKQFEETQKQHAIQNNFTAESLRQGRVRIEQANKNFDRLNKPNPPSLTTIENTASGLQKTIDGHQKTRRTLEKSIRNNRALLQSGKFPDGTPIDDAMKAVLPENIRTMQQQYTEAEQSIKETRAIKDKYDGYLNVKRGETLSPSLNSGKVRYLPPPAWKGGSGPKTVSVPPAPPVTRKAVPNGPRQPQHRVKSTGQYAPSPKKAAANTPRVIKSGGKTYEVTIEP